jgi:predicted kinase
MSPRKVRTLESDVLRILGFLKLPQPQHTAPTLILTSGLPGSGKSTFCRRLAQATSAVILESDALRRLLFDEPRYTVNESHRLFAAIHAAAEHLLSRGRLVIIDATSLSESDRRPVYRLAERTHATLHLLHFTASREVIEQRLVRRARREDGRDASSAGLTVYLLMEQRAEPPLREHRRIDTSDPMATEAALLELIEACGGDRKPVGMLGLEEETA